MVPGFINNVTFRRGSPPGYDAYKYPALSGYCRRDPAGNPVPWLALNAAKSFTLHGLYRVVDPEAAGQTPLIIEAEDLATGVPAIRDTAISQILAPPGRARELTIEANCSRANRFGNEVKSVAGQIAAAVYDSLPRQMVLVHPKGSQPSFGGTELQKYLNDVYGQAMVSWNVRFEEFSYKFPNELQTGNLQLSSYSRQMKGMISAFKKSNKPDGKTYYIFLVDGIEGGIGGYMPMKGQFGFVSRGGSVMRTIAHELGHGAFRLWHTFSSESVTVAAQGMTDNLMDYASGTKLYKHQWGLLHDPEIMVMTFLVDEEEGKLYAADDVKELLETVGKANIASQVVVTVPEIVRLEDIVDDLNLRDSASTLNPSLTKNEFLSSFTHEETLELAEKLRNRTIDTLSNYPTDYNPIILANKVNVTVGGIKYKLTINGYAMTERIYTTHIAEDVTGDEHKLIFYNARRVGESTDREERRADISAYRGKTDLTDEKTFVKHLI